MHGILQILWCILPFSGSNQLLLGSKCWGINRVLILLLYLHFLLNFQGGIDGLFHHLCCDVFNCGWSLEIDCWLGWILFIKINSTVKSYNLWIWWKHYFIYKDVLLHLFKILLNRSESYKFSISCLLAVIFLPLYITSQSYQIPILSSSSTCFINYLLFCICL